jgi:hypothetical protein
MSAEARCHRAKEAREASMTHAGVDLVLAELVGPAVPA